jgi:hypothetical protein
MMPGRWRSTHYIRSNTFDPLPASGDTSTAASPAPNKAACEAFEHVKKMYFHLHDDV